MLKRAIFLRRLPRSLALARGDRPDEWNRDALAHHSRSKTVTISLVSKYVQLRRPLKLPRRSTTRAVTGAHTSTSSGSVQETITRRKTSRNAGGLSRRDRPGQLQQSPGSEGVRSLLRATPARAILPLPRHLSVCGRRHCLAPPRSRASAGRFQRIQRILPIRSLTSCH